MIKRTVKMSWKMISGRRETIGARAVTLKAEGEAEKRYADAVTASRRGYESRLEHFGRDRAARK